MTRYAIDARTAIRIAQESVVVEPEHRLVAPAVLRSQALALVYRQHREGELSSAEARRILDGITTMKIRLLGDRVSRAVAWRIAEQHGWDDTTDAEYIAVAQLQADAFIAADERLAALASEIVPLARFEALGISG